MVVFLSQKNNLHSQRCTGLHNDAPLTARWSWVHAAFFFFKRKNLIQFWLVSPFSVFLLWQRRLGVQDSWCISLHATHQPPSQVLPRQGFALFLNILACSVVPTEWLIGSSWPTLGFCTQAFRCSLWLKKRLLSRMFLKIVASNAEVHPVFFLDFFALPLEV